MVAGGDEAAFAGEDDGLGAVAEAEFGEDVGHVALHRGGADEQHLGEAEVLGLIAEGLNNAAVAESLVLSPKAVAKHINSIFSKLGLGEEDSVHRRVKAVLMWLSA